VLKHYTAQKGRGHEGFGFVGIAHNRLLICRATREKGIRHYAKKNPLTEIMFHHRLPTSTDNTLETTHPIAVFQPIYRHKYYIIHNGIIMNSYQMKMKHEEMGIAYTTTQFSQSGSYWAGTEKSCEFNDSEALAHELALFLDGKQKEIEARGDMAFICLETDSHNNVLKLHFARNSGAPLEMKRDSHGLVIASEKVTNQDIPANELYTYDYRTQEISKDRIELPEFEKFSRFPTDSEFYWDEIEEIELQIQDYEDKLQDIRKAQMDASVKGDTVRYNRLQWKRDEIEEQIHSLYMELRWHWGEEL
jgi:glucosamine 6-phosphate synthetase-like amidotransferase/phosphosugar isomerase protein